MVASIYFIYQQDLKTFLDDAEDGVIYFSLGTLVRGESLPEDKVQAFISVFSELPQRVLWRMDRNVSLPNVKTSKWFPQLDVLSKLYKQSAELRQIISPLTLQWLQICSLLCSPKFLQEFIHNNVRFSANIFFRQLKIK